MANIFESFAAQRGCSLQTSETSAVTINTVTPNSSPFVLWSGILSIGGTFACRAQIVSHTQLEKPDKLGTCFNVTQKVGIAEGRRNLLNGIQQLQSNCESFNNGWYVNVCQLRPTDGRCNFNKLQLYLQQRDCMVVVKAGDDIILVSPDSKLMCDIGVPVSSKSACFLHCILLSKKSRKVARHQQSPNLQMTGEPRACDMDDKMLSHFGFCDRPPESSLLQRDRLQAAFLQQSQYEDQHRWRAEVEDMADGVHVKMKNREIDGDIKCEKVTKDVVIKLERIEDIPVKTQLSSQRNTNESGNLSVGDNACTAENMEQMFDTEEDVDMELSDSQVSSIIEMTFSDKDQKKVNDFSEKFLKDVTSSENNQERSEEKKKNYQERKGDKCDSISKKENHSDAVKVDERKHSSSTKGKDERHTRLDKRDEKSCRTNKEDEKRSSSSSRDGKRSSNRDENKHSSSSKRDEKKHSSSSKRDEKRHGSSKDKEKSQSTNKRDEKSNSSSKRDEKIRSSSKLDEKKHCLSKKDEKSHSSSKREEKGHSASQSDEKKHRSSDKRDEKRQRSSGKQDEKARSKKDHREHDNLHKTKDGKVSKVKHDAADKTTKANLKCVASSKSQKDAEKVLASLGVTRSQASSMAKIPKKSDSITKKDELRKTSKSKSSHSKAHRKSDRESYRIESKKMAAVTDHSHGRSEDLVVHNRDDMCNVFVDIGSQTDDEANKNNSSQEFSDSITGLRGHVTYRQNASPFLEDPSAILLDKGKLPGPPIGEKSSYTKSPSDMSPPLRLQHCKTSTELSGAKGKEDASVRQELQHSLSVANVNRHVTRLSSGLQCTLKHKQRPLQRMYVDDIEDLFRVFANGLNQKEVSNLSTSEQAVLESISCVFHKDICEERSRSVAEMEMQTDSRLKPLRITAEITGLSFSQPCSTDIRSSDKKVKMVVPAMEPIVLNDDDEFVVPTPVSNSGLLKTIRKEPSEKGHLVAGNENLKVPKQKDDSGNSLDFSLGSSRDIEQLNFTNPVPDKDPVCACMEYAQKIGATAFFQMEDQGTHARNQVMYLVLDRHEFPSARGNNKRDAKKAAACVALNCLNNEGKLKAIFPQVKTIPGAGKAATRSEALKTDSRQSRQYHPYKKKQRKKTTPTWSFDTPYRNLGELLQELTSSVYKEQKRKPAPVSSYHGHGRSWNSWNSGGRFSNYFFTRSTVPAYLPRSRSPSPSQSEDEEEMDENQNAQPVKEDRRSESPEVAPVTVDIIPNFADRHNTAELLETMFTEDTGESAIFSTEESIYEKEVEESRTKSKADMKLPQSTCGTKPVQVDNISKVSSCGSVQAERNTEAEEDEVDCSNVTEETKISSVDMSHKHVILKLESQSSEEKNSCSISNSPEKMKNGQISKNSPQFEAKAVGMSYIPDSPSIMLSNSASSVVEDSENVDQNNSENVDQNNNSFTDTSMCGDQTDEYICIDLTGDTDCFSGDSDQNDVAIDLDTVPDSLKEEFNSSPNCSGQSRLKCIESTAENTGYSGKESDQAFVDSEGNRNQICADNGTRDISLSSCTKVECGSLAAEANEIDMSTAEKVRSCLSEVVQEKKTFQELSKHKTDLLDCLTVANCSHSVNHGTEEPNEIMNQMKEEPHGIVNHVTEPSEIVFKEPSKTVNHLNAEMNHKTEELSEIVSHRTEVNGMSLAVEENVFDVEEIVVCSQTKDETIEPNYAAVENFICEEEVIDWIPADTEISVANEVVVEDTNVNAEEVCVSDSVEISYSASMVTDTNLTDDRLENSEDMKFPEKEFVSIQSHGTVHSEDNCSASHSLLIHNIHSRENTAVHPGNSSSPGQELPQDLLRSDADRSVGPPVSSLPNLENELPADLRKSETDIILASIDELLSSEKSCSGNQQSTYIAFSATNNSESVMFSPTTPSIDMIDEMTHGTNVSASHQEVEASGKVELSDFPDHCHTQSGFIHAADLHCASVGAEMEIVSAAGNERIAEAVKLLHGGPLSGGSHISNTSLEKDTGLCISTEQHSKTSDGDISQVSNQIDRLLGCPPSVVDTGMVEDLSGTCVPSKVDTTCMSSSSDTGICRNIMTITNMLHEQMNPVQDAESVEGKSCFIVPEHEQHYELNYLDNSDRTTCRSRTTSGEALRSRTASGHYDQAQLDILNGKMDTWFNRALTGKLRNIVPNTFTYSKQRRKVRLSRMVVEDAALRLTLSDMAKLMRLPGTDSSRFLQRMTLTGPQRPLKCPQSGTSFAVVPVTEMHANIAGCSTSSTYLDDSSGVLQKSSGLSVYIVSAKEALQSCVGNQQLSSSLLSVSSLLLMDKLKRPYHSSNLQQSGEIQARELASHTVVFPTEMNNQCRCAQVRKHSPEEHCSRYAMMLTRALLEDIVNTLESGKEVTVDQSGTPPRKIDLSDTLPTKILHQQGQIVEPHVVNFTSIRTIMSAYSEEEDSCFIGPVMPYHKTKVKLDTRISPPNLVHLTVQCSTSSDTSSINRPEGCQEDEENQEQQLDNATVCLALDSNIVIPHLPSFDKSHCVGDEEIAVPPLHPNTDWLKTISSLESAPSVLPWEGAEFKNQNSTIKEYDLKHEAKRGRNDALEADPISNIDKNDNNSDTGAGEIPATNANQTPIKCKKKKLKHKQMKKAKKAKMGGNEDLIAEFYREINPLLDQLENKGAKSDVDSIRKLETKHPFKPGTVAENIPFNVRKEVEKPEPKFTVTKFEKSMDVLKGRICRQLSDSDSDSSTKNLSSGDWLPSHITSLGRKRVLSGSAATESSCTALTKKTRLSASPVEDIIQAPGITAWNKTPRLSSSDSSDQDVEHKSVLTRIETSEIKPVYLGAASSMVEKLSSPQNLRSSAVDVQSQQETGAVTLPTALLTDTYGKTGVDQTVVQQLDNQNDTVVEERINPSVPPMDTTEVESECQNALRSIARQYSQSLESLHLSPSNQQSVDYDNSATLTPDTIQEERNALRHISLHYGQSSESLNSSVDTVNDQDTHPSENFLQSSEVQAISDNISANHFHAAATFDVPSVADTPETVVLPTELLKECFDKMTCDSRPAHGVSSHVTLPVSVSGVRNSNQSLDLNTDRYNTNDSSIVSPAGTKEGMTSSVWSGTSIPAALTETRSRDSHAYTPLDYTTQSVSYLPGTDCDYPDLDIESVQPLQHTYTYDGLNSSSRYTTDTNLHSDGTYFQRKEVPNSFNTNPGQQFSRSCASEVDDRPHKASGFESEPEANSSPSGSVQHYVQTLREEIEGMHSVPTVVPQVVSSIVQNVVPTIVPSLVQRLVPSVVPGFPPHVVPTVVPSVVPRIVPSVVRSIVPRLQWENSSYHCSRTLQRLTDLVGASHTFLDPHAGGAQPVETCHMLAPPHHTLNMQEPYSSVQNVSSVDSTESNSAVVLPSVQPNSFATENVSALTNNFQQTDQSVGRLPPSDVHTDMNILAGSLVSSVDTYKQNENHPEIIQRLKRPKLYSAYQTSKTAMTGSSAREKCYVEHKTPQGGVRSFYGPKELQSNTLTQPSSCSSKGKKVGLSNSFLAAYGSKVSKIKSSWEAMHNAEKLPDGKKQEKSSHAWHSPESESLASKTEVGHFIDSSDSPAEKEELSIDGVGSEVDKALELIDCGGYVLFESELLYHCSCDHLRELLIELDKRVAKKKKWVVGVHSSQICHLAEKRGQCKSLAGSLQPSEDPSEKKLDILSMFRHKGIVRLLPHHGCDDHQCFADRLLSCASKQLKYSEHLHEAYVLQQGNAGLKRSYNCQKTFTCGFTAFLDLL